MPFPKAQHDKNGPSPPFSQKYYALFNVLEKDWVISTLIIGELQRANNKLLNIISESSKAKYATHNHATDNG